MNKNDIVLISEKLVTSFSVCSLVGIISSRPEQKIAYRDILEEGKRINPMPFVVSQRRN